MDNLSNQVNSKTMHTDIQKSLIHITGKVLVCLFVMTFAQLAVAKTLNTVTSNTATLSEAEYKKVVKQFYNQLESKQNELKGVVDQQSSYAKIAQTACEYATLLRQLQQVSEENQQYVSAQDELKFIRPRVKNFDYSLSDLQMNYETSCKLK